MDDGVELELLDEPDVLLEPDVLPEPEGVVVVEVLVFAETLPAFPGTSVATTTPRTADRAATPSATAFVAVRTRLSAPARLLGPSPLIRVGTMWLLSSIASVVQGLAGSRRA